MLDNTPENRVSPSFEKKSNLLMRAYIESKDWTEYLNKVAEQIGLPVLAISDSFRMIGISSLETIDDEFWRNSAVSGYSTAGNTEYAINNLMHEMRSKKFHEIYSLHTERMKYPRMLVNLIHDGKFYGHLSALCIHPCTDDETRALFVLAADLLMKGLVLSKDPALMADDVIVSVLIDLLQGGIRNQDMMHARAIAASLEKSAAFQLISINAPTIANYRMQIDICDQAKRCLPRATVFVYENQLLVFLFGDSSATISQEELASLEGFLLRLDARAYISDEFYDLYDLQEHYKKNLRISRLAPTSRMSFYDDYKMIDMALRASVSDGRLNYNMFINKKILQIRHYDREHGTAYLDTLWYYLSSKESVNAAADALFVHRNTVVYRLSRIKELFDMDFSSNAKCMQYYFSCYFLHFYDSMKEKDISSLSSDQADWLTD